MTSWTPGEQPPAGQPQYGQPPQGGQPPYDQPAQPEGGQPPQGGQPQYGSAPQYGSEPQYGAPQPAGPSYAAGPPPAAPPYGQAQYGQPQYGQPQYGQPQYGQPQYGPPAGYPVPGPNQYGANAAALPPGAVSPLSIGNRVVAFIIDWAIIAVPALILYFILAAIFITTVSASYDPNTGEITTGSTSGAGIVLTIVPLLTLAAALYFVYLTGSTGQTPGKKIMGVKVIDAAGGGPIGFGRAFLRLLVQAVSNIACYAGLWSAFLDSSSGRYQGWHDKAANTLVISVK